MERNYEFRKTLGKFHQENLRDTTLSPNANEIQLTNDSIIFVPQKADRVILRAAMDLRDYLFTSMNVSVRILAANDPKAAIEAGRGNVAILTRRENPGHLGEGEGVRGYRIQCTDNILITGYDEPGALQGAFYLEEVMSFRHAPFIPKETVERRPHFTPRMIHSGYGLDQYPDAHIAAIARSGMDALLVFVKDVDTTPYGYMDFNELCWRAGEYGVDVYAYSYLHNDMHPDSPGAVEYYDNLYGSIFKHCPGFKGIVMVGESVEFPSKDPNTTGRLRLTPSPDGLPPTKPSPGWWPCEDYPQWLSLVRDSVRRYKSDADIVFWTYNWGYVDKEHRIALIDKLPTDISLLVTFEMFEKIKTGDVTTTCVDYTLMFTGPGQYFISEAQAAHRRGIRLYSMVNTGGLTWDIGVIPYEPVPYQWMERHRQINNMREQYGLCGLMESHHFGFWPSFISHLAKESYTAGGAKPDDMLRKLAARDLGEKNADEVLAIWRLWSEGIQHYRSTNEDQYGPFRIGPAYPLTISGPIPPPQSPFAMFGNSIFSTHYGHANSGRCSLQSFRLPEEIQSITIMRDRFWEGADRMDALVPTLSEPYRQMAKRMANLGRFMGNSAQTTVHVKNWYLAKNRLLHAPTNGALRSAAEEMSAIARAEIENAKNTIPLVQEDSRLGWEPSMEYMCDEAHLRWKIAQVTRVLEHDLAMYLNSTQYQDK